MLTTVDGEHDQLGKALAGTTQTVMSSSPHMRNQRQIIIEAQEFIGKNITSCQACRQNSQLKFE